MPKLLATGLRLPESPRWHADAFWFSDIWGGRIYRLDTAFNIEVVADAEMPSGLGWLPDGSMLVVEMKAQAVMRLTNGRLTRYADLSPLASHWCNDLIVDARGTCYVGCTGGEPSTAPVTPAPLIGITPTCELFVAATNLHFPNGMAFGDNGRTLFVAETGAGRITAFSIDEHGRLHSRRMHARLKGRWPDGIDIDAHGRLWVADPRGGSLVRLSAAGNIDRLVDPDRGIPIACAVGGPADSHLLVCAAEQLTLADMKQMKGHIELHVISNEASN